MIDDNDEERGEQLAGLQALMADSEKSSDNVVNEKYDHRKAQDMVEPCEHVLLLSSTSMRSKQQEDKGYSSG